ncbi:MAG: dihydropteroate synthase [Phycisphaerales bacterium]|nr:MAG: dihydropteroate synthase [Phycisphaerales bacterium]
MDVHPPARCRTAPSWRISPDRSIALDRPILMGILNITPDSFSDGGQHLDPDHAIASARAMREAGAHLIDIGGESTRPGAARIDADEQIRRVLPVIERLRDDPEVILSIDTTRRDVAERAIDAGARIVNDVSAGEEDESILRLAAERECGIILMHRLRPPDQDRYSDQYEQDEPTYDDVVDRVRMYLLERAERAQACGVARESIVIDPGLGFGKTVAQNFALIDRLDELTQTGYPVLCAASRKSFLGKMTGVETPSDRVSSSVAVSVMSYERGVRLFRVHDIQPHREALAVAEAAGQTRLNANFPDG